MQQSSIKANTFSFYCQIKKTALKSVVIVQIKAATMINIFNLSMIIRAVNNISYFNIIFIDTQDNFQEVSSDCVLQGNKPNTTVIK